MNTTLKSLFVAATLLASFGSHAAVDKEAYVKEVKVNYKGDLKFKLANTNWSSSLGCSSAVWNKVETDDTFAKEAMLKILLTAKITGMPVSVRADECDSSGAAAKINYLTLPSL
ncbi:MAG: hypothetical protein ACC657_18280 [Thiohalomonadales bacterium]